MAVDSIPGEMELEEITSGLLQILQYAIVK
jgi:hypothetical protein